MTRTRPLSGPSQAAVALLAAGVVGAATGVIPMAGLYAAPAVTPALTSTPPLVLTPVAVTPVAVTPVTFTPVATPPSIVGAWPQALSNGPLTVRTGTSQTVLQRGQDGETWLVTTVEVGKDPAPATRQPIDLALVLDTSGSMAETHGSVQAMPLMRRATLGLIERLGPDDRLVLVAYSSDARVLFEGPIGAEGHARLEQIVSGLEAHGGTNISEGLREGVRGLARLGGAQADEARARRMVLLTDGKPTLGQTDPRDLTALVAEQRGAGQTLSTLGLGQSYNEDLLAAMADRGGGAYHYAASAEGLGKVYEAELNAARRLAARGVSLAIVPADGVEVLGVESWPATAAGGATHVALGDLSFGQTVKVVARVRVKTGATGGPTATRPFAEVAVTMVPRGGLEGEGPTSVARLPLGITLSDDPAEVAQGRVAALDEELKRVEVSRSLREARTAAASGDRERARQLVRQAREVAGDELRYDAPSGEGRAVDLRGMEEALGSNDAPAAARAMKVAAEADRAGSR